MGQGVNRYRMPGTEARSWVGEKTIELPEYKANRDRVMEASGRIMHELQSTPEMEEMRLSYGRSTSIVVSQMATRALQAIAEGASAVETVEKLSNDIAQFAAGAGMVVGWNLLAMSNANRVERSMVEAAEGLARG